MIIILFLLITILLTITDIKSYWIPNIVVIPAIIWGMILTGSWVWALVLFIIGAWFFKKKKLAGGDVKLMTMCGAFLGWIAIPVFILSRLFIWGYRNRTFYNHSLPFAPFVLVSSCVIIATSKVIRWLIALPALTAGGV